MLFQRLLERFDFHRTITMPYDSISFMSQSIFLFYLFVRIILDDLRFPRKTKSNK